MILSSIDVGLQVERAPHRPNLLNSHRIAIFAVQLFSAIEIALGCFSIAHQEIN
jgi:hypothetical protein